MRIELPVEHRVTAGYQFSNQWIDATGRVLTWQEITETLNADRVAREALAREELALARAVARDARAYGRALADSAEDDSHEGVLSTRSALKRAEAARDRFYASHPEVLADA